jgi:hypothetical protein
LNGCVVLLRRLQISGLQVLPQLGECRCQRTGAGDSQRWW